MKKIFSAIAVILFAAITLTSCGGNDISKVSKIFNETADKINADAANNYASIDSLYQEFQKQLEPYRSSTCEFTDSDYQTFAEAILNLNIAASKIEAFYWGYEAPELTEQEKADKVKEYVENLKADVKTLGQFLGGDVQEQATEEPDVVFDEMEEFQDEPLQIEEAEVDLAETVDEE